MKRVALIFAALTITLGCGDDATKTPNGSSNAGTNVSTNVGNNDASVSDLPDILWTSICDAVFTCENVNPQFVQILGRYPDAATCKADGVAPFLDLDFDYLIEAESAGRLAVDQAQVGACVAALQDNLCQGLGFEEAPECEQVLTGNVAEGESCGEDEECTGDRECRGVSGECYGTCENNCGTENCTVGQFCDNDTCVARLGEGVACDFDSQCADGLLCSGDVDSTCQTPFTVSESGSCNRQSDCEQGLVCADGICNAFSFVASGASCQISEATQDVCEPGSVCTDLVLEGQAFIGTCGPPKTQGGECRIFLECAVGLTCTATNPLMSGTCEALFANGSMCSQDFDCESANCVDGTCTAREMTEVCTLP